MKQYGIPLREALAKAGATRLRPVLLTAVTTVLGLMPMALGISIDFTTFSIDTGSPTAEMWGPMAKAVSFGLAVATLLTLIFVPVMYLAQQNGNAWIKRTAEHFAGMLRRRPSLPKPATN
jgi:multidrug efflux pump subunit AcrB